MSLLQPLNVGPTTFTPERSSTGINRRPSRIGEEGYYLPQDLEALYAKWKTEYNRNKRAHLKQARLLDMRKNKHMISKRRHRRLNHRAMEKPASRTSDGEDENDSSGDKQSFSEEEVAGDSGLLTGDSAEDEDGDLHDDDSDDEEGSSRRRRRRRRSDSGSKGNRRQSSVKSSLTLSSKKQLKRNQATKQEVKRHACPICGKRFSRPSQLYTHSLTHSGEVNFCCIRMKAQATILFYFPMLTLLHYDD
ncbi:hypothetical protein CPC16_009574 [Podila verticillata]|nr:hypothetical protein CPC16_009574 [Podila verticillata]